MTEFKVSAASMADIDDLVAIESSALPGYGYVYDDRFFYLEKQGNEGEMVLVRAGKEAVGMGMYSVMPNGDGWLECLRVKKEWQRHGAGKTIYKRYLELAEQYDAEEVGMYTGMTNKASKGLAELNGFRLGGRFREFVLDLSEAKPRKIDLSAWREVTRLSEAITLIDSDRADWGRWISLNRTWMRFSEELYQYLIGRHMIYTDGKNALIFGCRMLENRGRYIAWYGGDARACFDFAREKTTELGLPKLYGTVPMEARKIQNAFTGYGFEKGPELIIEILDRKAEKEKE